MSIEELLRPVFRLVQNYPNSGFITGEIINIGTNLMPDGINKFSDYPSLFQKINWWQDVDIKDMPKYLKHTSDRTIYYKVKKYEFLNDGREKYWIDEKLYKHHGFYGNYGIFFLPCSEEEYLSCNNAT